MNKSALKNFATKARTELLERVELEARKIGITKETIEEATVESSDAVFINDRQLSDIERKQRNQLIARIDEIGFDRVMEEAAYTWFNRFVALRFMEVNDYLPTRVRVLSSENEGSTEPDMMTEALSLDLEIDRDLVYNLKLENKTDELFKYLIKLHCNDLNRYMPFMFETIEDYNDILFPEGLLGTDSFVREMTDTEIIPEDNWRNVEIIGWLYQYYIAEEKDEVFANLKKNIKITQDTLPAATQLFTPHWIVRYMVENSLGRIWLEGNPDSHLKDDWKYYLEEAEQEEAVNNELEEIIYKDVNPEKIKFLDPACGSGHILVYAFDVFYSMYLEKGYLKSEIPKLILEKNLYGTDIDNRAAQLASFALMMKAREKSRRIFRQQPQLNIIAIQDSNWLTDEMIDEISKDDANFQYDLNIIKERFANAKEFGSLLRSDDLNFEYIKSKVNEYLDEDDLDLFEYSMRDKLSSYFPKLFKQIDLLKKKYDVVCTNPPYMGRRSMNPLLNKFLDKNHPDTKADLFAAFIERGFDLTKENGFNAMVTMQSWMFLSTFEKIRTYILENKTIYSLLHMDNMVMGIAFGTSATIFRNIHIDEYNGRFTEVKYKDINESNVPKEFPINKNRQGIMSAESFSKIPGNPIAYWSSKQDIDIFDNDKKISDVADIKQGLATADNNRFLRLWHEVKFNKIGFNYHNEDEALLSGRKWFPYNKGGSFRKWYGNQDYVVNWEENGKEIKSFVDERGRQRSRPQNTEYYFMEGITWSFVSSSYFGVRYSPPGFIFDVGGSSLFPKNSSDIRLLTGLLVSKLSSHFLSFINPTLNFQVGNIGNIPLPLKISVEKKDAIEQLVSKSINISKNDWDYLETSWDFKENLLLKFPSKTIETSFGMDLA